MECTPEILSINTNLSKCFYENNQHLVHISYWKLHTN